jgi:ribose transport system permease protein
VSAVPTTPDMRTSLPRGAWRYVTRNAWVTGVIVLLILMIFEQRRASPAWSEFDMQTLAIGAVPLAFAAMGQAVIIIGGGVDLSLGNQMALVSVVAARMMMDESFGHALAICALLIVGSVLIGVLTGLVIAVSGVPDIVVTLAMSFVWLGVALYVLGFPGGGVPIEFSNLASLNTVASTWPNRSEVIPYPEYIPISIVILIIVFLAVWIPISRTRMGLSFYAIGSSKNAAYLAGIDVRRAKVLSYAVGGIFTGCAGLALTATTGIGDANTGTVGNYTLNSVAAVVLGGVSLAGGIGGLLGPMVGAFVLELVSTILLLHEVDPNWAQVIQGSLIIVVVAVGGLLLQRRKA